MMRPKLGVAGLVLAAGGIAIAVPLVSDRRFAVALALSAVGLLVAAWGAWRTLEGAGYKRLVAGFALATLGGATGLALSAGWGGLWWVAQALFFLGSLGAFWQAVRLWRVADDPERIGTRMALALIVAAGSPGWYFVFNLRELDFTFLPSNVVVITGLLVAAYASTAGVSLRGAAGTSA
ncbi:MAG: hypothetical protein ACT4PT_00885 [Methanobacteriota archaeon]